MLFGAGLELGLRSRGLGLRVGASLLAFEVGLVSRLRKGEGLRIRSLFLMLAFRTIWGLLFEPSGVKGKT